MSESENDPDDDEIEIESDDGGPQRKGSKSHTGAKGTQGTKPRRGTAVARAATPATVADDDDDVIIVSGDEQPPRGMTFPAPEEMTCATAATPSGSVGVTGRKRPASFLQMAASTQQAKGSRGAKKDWGAPR